MAGDPPVMTVKTSGRATLEGMAALRLAIFSHPSFRPDVDMIVDHSDLEGSLSGDEVRALAERAAADAREQGATGRRAFIMSRPLTFGLARMWESYASGDYDGRLRVVSTLDEAHAWMESSS